MGRIGANDSERGILRKIGNRIRQVREEKKISPAAIAEKLGMRTGNYTPIENGEDNITIVRLAQILKALELDGDFLNDKSPIPNNDPYKKIIDMLRAVLDDGGEPALFLDGNIKIFHERYELKKSLGVAAPVRSNK